MKKITLIDQFDFNKKKKKKSRKIIFSFRVEEGITEIKTPLTTARNGLSTASLSDFSCTSCIFVVWAYAHFWRCIREVVLFRTTRISRWCIIKRTKKKKKKTKMVYETHRIIFIKYCFIKKKKSTWQKVTLFIIFTIESIIRKKLDENFPQRVKKKRKKKTKARNRLGKNKYSGKE